MLPPSLLQRLPNGLMFAVALLLFVLLSHYFYLQIGDDSYIYYRYVERALAGKPWSWTDQIAAVEGYSSPLWYGLLILFSALGVSVSVLAPPLGLVFAAFTLLLMFKLCALLQLSNRQAATAFYLLLINTGFYYWSTSGLETALYMAVFLWVVIGMMQCKNWLVPVALIGVLRPEGPILLAALLIAMKLTYKERVSLSQLLIAVLPTLLWLGLRLSIYGLPLPNTFYAKASSGSVQQMVKGVFYCLPVLLPLLWCWWQWRKEKENMLMVGLGAGTMLLGIVLFGGGDWMFHLRLLQPLLAVLIVISVYYFVKVSNLQRGFLLFLSLPYLLFAVTPSDALKALQLKQLSPEYYQEGLLTHASMELAEEIEQRYEKGSVIAVNHAGALPFALEGFNFIDMVGLNDAHIAKAEGDVHAKYDVGYVLQSKPDLIVLNSRTEPGTDGRYYHKGYWVGEDALVEHPLFNQYYEPANLVRQWHWRMIFPYSLFKKEYTSWIIVYQRKANTAATSRSNTEY